MENVNVEFNIKLNKKIYEENNYKTRNDFFSQSVLMNVASDYIFILNLLKNKDNKEKEKYSNYLETLKNIKQSFLDSVTYEVINEEGDIEEVKIKLNFNYYENEINTLEDTVRAEIFTRNIKSNYFLTEDITRVLSIINQEEKGKSMKRMYKHIGDFLNEAKSSVFINEKEFNFS